MTKFFRIAALLLCASQLPAQAETPAASTEIPDRIEGAETIDAEDLIHLADTLPALVMVDSRITTDRKHGHIEGSLSLPDIDTDCDSLAALSANKSDPIMFYCNGVKCGRSVVAARKALGCGYDAVYWFRGGFEEWTKKDYPYVTE